MSIHNILSQMEHHMPILVLLLLLIKSCNSQLLPIVDDETHKYIIDVERHEQHELLSDSDLERFHLSFLPNSTLDSGAPRFIYSYRHVLNGFAARLTQEELETIKLKPGFLYAQRNCYYPLATTYTPRYLGLTMNNAWGSTMMGQGLIIGILDTGIKASHPSFKDTNMPPPPPVTKWKGSCFNGFACNNKIIGAKAFFNGSNPSPKDTEGHGTHVASIAAGNFVKNANVLGMAKGDPASGVAPMAHLSIYKVCFPNSGCAKIDIYAAIDQAIKDGVDIISMSIGGGTISTLYDDAISRGSMAVIQHGIVPITAAGNDGPDSASLSSSSAPWLLTVGASTTDRRVTSIVELGNGRTFPGESAYQPKSWNSSAMWQLEYPGENGDQDYRCCVPSVMTNLNLRGKIVLCVACEVKDDVRGEAAYKAGAMGMIVMNHPLDGYTTQSPAHILPAANVDYRTRLDILSYYNNNKPNASAAIRFDGTHFGFKPSPTVASFSSRGPSSINGGIIKPDVLAPGVNILAAWHTDVGPNPNPLATHTFNFDSGTSMATPHVSGIVALVKSKHRGWSPAEILSAIVTTANDAGTVGGDLIVDSSYDSAGIYAMGAGEVNPIKAMDPGLVFGLAFEDYVGYLCGLAYNNTEVTLIVGKQMNCSGIKHLSASELNYPSIAVNLTRLVKSQKVTRTAKNVGDAREEYMAKITEPVGVRVDLSTYTLKFTRVDQEVSYDINFVLNGAYPSQGSEMIRRGKIVWDSGKHVVTTPIAVRFV